MTSPSSSPRPTTSSSPVTGVLQDVPVDDNGYTLYFAYGSNLCETQVLDRVGPVAFTLGACLPDHEVVFDKATGGDHAYANVVPKPDAVVMGKVYALTAKQLSEMDDYEGAPVHYSRLALNVKIFDEAGDDQRLLASSDFNSIRKRGTFRVSAVYVANPKFRTATPLKPSKAYLRKLLLGGPLVPRWYTSWLASHETA